MLVYPQRMEPVWFSRTLMRDWPQREGVAQGIWQAKGPDLLAFYGAQSAAHTQWQLPADDGLVSQARTLLVRLMGVRNSDATLYQKMLSQVAHQYPAVATGTFNHAAPESPETTKTDPVRWVYVAQPEPQSNIDVVAALPEPVKPWGSFAAGMCTMLVAGAAAVWGWQHFNRPDPQEQQLLATIAPLPAMLTPAQRDAARQRLTSPEPFIEATQQQLTRLDALPPDWNIAYSRQLVEQAQALWPEQAESMALQWQQQLNVSALPTENMEGWHQGMTKLKQLSDRLNQMDEQKGKYMTVSELKSVVFSAMQSFNQAIPAEEQLRVLAKSPAGQPLPVAASAQTEMHLKQLTARYSEIKQKASSK